MTSESIEILYRVIPPKDFANIISMAADGTITREGAKKMIRMYGLFYFYGVQGLLDSPADKIEKILPILENCFAKSISTSEAAALILKIQ